MSSQSCLVEPPRVIRLKLAPSLPNPSHGSDDWLRNCFFQSPPDTSPSSGENSPEYVHPLTKQRLSMLSEKSLEMCTESLGSETGTHAGDYYVSPAAVRGGEETKPRTAMKKLDRAQSFPPPLTSTGMRVRSRREGGRLVVEAVAAAEWRSVLRVYRSEGRTRVEMVRDADVAAEVAVVDGCGMEVNNGIVEGELGTGKFGRPIRRCVESQRRSNSGLLKQNWEPLLVTI